MNIKHFLFGFLIYFSLVLVAQEPHKNANLNSYSPYSLKNIKEHEIMHKKTVIRMLDLREKHNQPLFTKGQELTKLIMEGIHEGVMTPYENDSLWDGTIMTTTQFMDRLLVPDVDMEYESLMEQEDDSWNEDENNNNSGDDNEWGSDLDDLGDFDDFNSEETESSEDDPYADPFAGEDFTTEVSFGNTGQHFTPRDIYMVEIKENIFFNKKSMEAEYDILAITLFIPADHPDNIMGIDIPVATFSYKELVEHVFRDNPDANWINPFNDSENRNLETAMELRLFTSYIVKISNAKDEWLVDVYGGDPEKGIMASQWEAFDMLEQEQYLWEY